MHHIGKKFKSANFIYEILISKIIDNILPENIVIDELNENNENIQVKIEKINNREEEDLIEIKHDNTFIASWKDNILPPNINLNLKIF
jgi:uncharacterized membrane protein